MTRFVVLTLCFAFTMMGCRSFTRGVIKADGVTVKGVLDAGKPATLASDVKWEGMTLPKGSSLTLTKFGASVGTPDTKAEPAKEVTEVHLAEATEWKRTENVINADTGTVDTSIAKHRIDAEENRFLLWASLGALVASGVFLYLKYPTPGFICAGAAVVLFAAWKLAGLPPWFHVIGISALVGAVMLWRGHARGEADGIKAAMSGDVEPKNPPVVKS